MKSLWSDENACERVDRYGLPCDEDLDLRVYTSGLIGREQDLVLNGEPTGRRSRG